MEIKTSINPADFTIGVIMARFQTHKLTEGHIKFVNQVCSNHPKVIIFLGISNIPNSKSNPLDFATRKAMIQERYPDVVVLPQRDNRDDKVWSKNLDAQITMPYGELSAVLYGSRDSFIPHYHGKYPVIELITDIIASATDYRKKVGNEIIPSEDFRAGVIHGTWAQRPVTYPTVDVVAYNDKGEVLLGKKPNEKKYRFIGGFVDRTDTSWEHAAKREFAEETGGCAIDDLRYVASSQIKDWRYVGSESGIMTTLFIGKFLWGKVTATDDIESLAWVTPDSIIVENDIMPEHQELFTKLLDYLVKNKMV